MVMNVITDLAGMPTLIFGLLGLILKPFFDFYTQQEMQRILKKDETGEDQEEEEEEEDGILKKIDRNTTTRHIKDV